MAEYIYTWSNTAKRAKMKDRCCEIISWGRDDTCMVKFRASGKIATVSRWALRRLPRSTTMSDEAILNQHTPHGTGADIATLVQRDIEARARVGEQKYGERLRAHNGRRSLVDAYQEALDLCMYLRQALEEKSAPENNAQKQPSEAM
jgi:hypothetical protein